MAILTQAPKGTQDILPGESRRWQYVERMLLSVARLYGFEEIRTPTFEHTELFVRSVGDTTDVVQKEMYTFNDKKDRSITLKPEGTAGTVRAALEHGLAGGQLPIKACYITPCFRYEKPQAGRLREFHQFGVENFGAPGPAADVEVIALADQALRRLGVTRIRLMLNSIGCPQCRPHYHAALRSYLESHRENLCPTCLQRLDTNPMRVLDCKSPVCAAIAAEAPKVIDFLCGDCKDHFAGVRRQLKALGIPFEIDPTIVRGLDYYTRTVFEFVTDAIGAQGTVCGGGRYDGLFAALGGSPLPGMGFGMGLERLLLVMEASNAPFPAPARCALYIAPMGSEAAALAARLCAGLRGEGFFAECDLMNRSVKAQMRYADKLGAAYSLVLGEQELSEGKAVLKRMDGGPSLPIALDDGFAAHFAGIAPELRML
jgi:histidyl-tRNA synthetase